MRFITYNYLFMIQFIHKLQVHIFKLCIQLTIDSYYIFIANNIFTMEFVNNFKALTYQYNQLQHRRLSIDSTQLDQYWQNKTLNQMANILTINEDSIINYILTQLLQPIIASRRIIYEAYIVYKTVGNQQITCLYAYDCKIFKNYLYSKEQNDFISSFLLCYKQADHINQSVYEMIDADKIDPKKWLLLVKQSSILRVYSYIKEAFKKNTDKIIMEKDKSLTFMQEWIKCYYNYRLEIMTNNFFKGILALLQNQILLDYFQSLTPQQKYERMYIKPVKKIQKPKNIQQFTQTQKHFGEISWQTLKIILYQLKYKIKQQQDGYLCYRIEQEVDEQSLDQLSQQDRNMLIAFNNLRLNEQQYQNNYHSNY